MKRQRSSFYLFTISFLISLGILVLVMAAVFSASARVREPEVSSEPADLSTQNYHPDKEDGFRVLVIWAGDHGEAESFALLSMDPLAAKVTLLSLPGEFSVELDGREGTLLSHDAYAGSAEAVRAAEALLGLKIDRWVRVGRKGAVNMIDALGGMEWEFSEPLETERLSIPVGRHLLDGETVMALMEEQSSGKPLPGNIQIAANLLGQRVTESLLNKGDWFFQVLVSNTDSDISQFDYQRHKKMFRWYLTSEERKLETLTITGERRRDGRLQLSEEDRAEISVLTGGALGAAAGNE